MIYTGIDLVDSRRIQKALQSNEEAFLNRICTKNEIEQIKDHKRIEEKLAGIFALKEAFSKALGTGIGENFGFHDSEVSHSEKGQPRLSYLGQKFSAEISGWQISCSLSHEGDMVAAVVVLQTEMPLSVVK